MKQRALISATALGMFLVLVAAAAGHELDHPAPQFQPAAPIGTGVNSGGPGASWKLVTTFPTGNPHTDLDFFTQSGETYASVGTLAAGANGGGQTIVQLTDRGTVNPRYVASHPSAECASRPDAALGLQHDVEVTPKGGTLLNTAAAAAVGGDAQLLVDATDQRGRCHDQGTAGIANAPRGGLELVDITNVLRPVEIGLTSHVGESHTVNIDPKRPHIAYSVTSDAVSVGPAPEYKRQNEVPGSADRFDLDGFEVVDMSSCMNFPSLTSVDMRRILCRPDVYRYRFPSTFVSLGHTTQNAVYGCHELELYPDDTLTCGSGAAAIVFDMSGAFDRNGKPKGTPLPCNVRPSSTVGPTFTRAMVTDCVVGEGGQNLDIPTWLASGAPSLEGVRYVGSIHHQGRGGPHPSTEDNDFDHELELSATGKHLIATDERGGGVTPPGATCATGVDNPNGNGGVQFYKRSALRNSLTSVPTTDEAWQAYARTPSGAKAIYRATPRTGAEPTVCTAHVFQQIPGQNRIFMGWYSQGTQVVDFVERADGTVELREAGWFIPEKANTWTSAVFKMRQNANGTFTYWGATGDFLLGTTGRSAIDVYEVTMPAPPLPAGGGSGGGGGGNDVEKATGGGWLADAAGKKINLGFQVKGGAAPSGQVQLNDKAAGAKIHLDEVTSVGEVLAGCGSVVAGANALEFRGRGRYNDTPGATFRVCVSDGSEDRFVLKCVTGCTYDTDARTPDDVLDGGNIQVHRPGAAIPTGDPQPATLMLEPMLASTAVSGQPQTFGVRVFDQRQDPLANATVTLTRTTAAGVETLTAPTGVGGVATIVAVPPLGEAEYVASAGGVRSNAVALATTP